MKHIILNSKIIGIGIFSIAALSACAEDQSPEFDRIVLSALLSQTWVRDCVIDGDNSYLPTLTFTSNGVESFNSGSGSTSNITHTDNTTCSSLIPETLDITTFDYTLVNDITVDGSIEGIIEATELDMVDTTEDSASIGTAEFDIFAIKDKYTLYFGSNEDPYDGTTIDSRPVQLSDSIIYIR